MATKRIPRDTATVRDARITATRPPSWSAGEIAGAITGFLRASFRKQEIDTGTAVELLTSARDYLQAVRAPCQPVGLYMLVVYSDVEPEIVGAPYRNDAERLADARRHRADTDRDGLYRVDVDARGVPSVTPFLGREIETD
jgi:hypothetical protein